MTSPHVHREAGPLLNIEIAEKVMGITQRQIRVKGEVDTPPVSVWNDSPWFQDGRHDREDLEAHGKPLPYSGPSLLYTQQVLDRLAERYRVQITSVFLNGEKRAWTVSIDKPLGFGDWQPLADEESESLPLAICLAALQCVSALSGEAQKVKT